MPRFAVMSDPHSNLEALKSVLDDIALHDVDEIICMGDLVGYGPQPQECCDLARRKGVTLLQGNHEQGLINIHYLHGFNQPAKDALRMTREMISSETYEWLVSQPRSITRGDCRFVHGVPPDSLSDYIWKHENQMETVFSRYQEGVCFVGHTHDLMRFTYAAGVASPRLRLSEGKTQLEQGVRHLVNVGAVGQPRDGDNRAKYVLYNTTSQTVNLRCIPYNIKKTADLIRSRGFHRGFAERLW